MLLCREVCWWSRTRHNITVQVVPRRAAANMLRQQQKCLDMHCCTLFPATSPSPPPPPQHPHPHTLSPLLLPVSPLPPPPTTHHTGPAPDKPLWPAPWTPHTRALSTSLSPGAVPFFFLCQAKERNETKTKQNKMRINKQTNKNIA